MVETSSEIENGKTTLIEEYEIRHDFEKNSGKCLKRPCSNPRRLNDGAKGREVSAARVILKEPCMRTKYFVYCLWLQSMKMNCSETYKGAWKKTRILLRIVTRNA